MIDYLFAIWACVWMVVQLPYPGAAPYPLYKVIALLVGIILILFALMYGHQLHPYWTH
jgi:hypothetical protein